MAENDDKVWEHVHAIRKIGRLEGALVAANDIVSLLAVITRRRPDSRRMVELRLAVEAGVIRAADRLRLRGKDRERFFAATGRTEAAIKNDPGGTSP